MAEGEEDVAAGFLVEAVADVDVFAVEGAASLRAVV